MRIARTVGLLGALLPITASAAAQEAEQLTLLRAHLQGQLTSIVEAYEGVAGVHVVDLTTGERRTLWTGPHTEIDVAPDGTSVVFCSGAGHLGMGLARLRLEPPSGTDRLPRALGEPVDIVRPEGVWHVHNADWSPDGRRVAFIHDADRSTIYELPAEATR